MGEIREVIFKNSSIRSKRLANVMMEKWFEKRKERKSPDGSVSQPEHNETSVSMLTNDQIETIEEYRKAYQELKQKKHQNKGSESQEPSKMDDGASEKAENEPRGRKGKDEMEKKSKGESNREQKEENGGEFEKKKEEINEPDLDETNIGRKEEENKEDGVQLEEEHEELASEKEQEEKGNVPEAEASSHEIEEGEEGEDRSLLSQNEEKLALDPKKEEYKEGSEQKNEEVLSIEDEKDSEKRLQRDVHPSERSSIQSIEKSYISGGSEEKVIVKKKPKQNAVETFQRAKEKIKLLKKDFKEGLSLSMGLTESQEAQEKPKELWKSEKFEKPEEKEIEFEFEESPMDFKPEEPVETKAIPSQKEEGFEEFEEDEEEPQGREGLRVSPEKNETLEESIHEESPKASKGTTRKPEEENPGEKQQPSSSLNDSQHSKENKLKKPADNQPKITPLKTKGPTKADGDRRINNKSPFPQAKKTGTFEKKEQKQENPKLFKSKTTVEKKETREKPQSNQNAINPAQAKEKKQEIPEEHLAGSSKQENKAESSAPVSNGSERKKPTPFKEFFRTSQTAKDERALSTEFPKKEETTFKGPLPKEKEQKIEKDEPKQLGKGPESEMMKPNEKQQETSKKPQKEELLNKTQKEPESLEPVKRTSHANLSDQSKQEELRRNSFESGSSAPFNGIGALSTTTSHLFPLRMAKEEAPNDLSKFRRLEQNVPHFSFH